MTTAAPARTRMGSVRLAAAAAKRQLAHDDHEASQQTESPRKRARTRKDSKNSSETEDEPLGVETSTTRHASPAFLSQPLPQNFVLPKRQQVLLLRQIKEAYHLEPEYTIPSPDQSDELLIQTLAIGLNPIDWKAPDFGFGIPTLPYISGRELVGRVVSIPAKDVDRTHRKLSLGDVVLFSSTDYRDLRKAAFQQYAVASNFTVARIPASVGSPVKVAGLGVAFVAAALSLGVCFGCDFSEVKHGVPAGPNLKALLRSVRCDEIPADVRKESLEGIEEHERPFPGDWIAIWGGSSATAFIATQLAKHLGLRVLKIVDIAKHGERLHEGPADFLVDSHDSDRAQDVIRKFTKGNLRFGIDTVGKPTAQLLRDTLKLGDLSSRSHLVGLTGLPKDPVEGIQPHTVPIKLHHESPTIGEALNAWLEQLLATGNLAPPKVEVAAGGLGGINAGLDRMRKGEISGRRLAVELEI